MTAASADAGRTAILFDEVKRLGIYSRMRDLRRYYRSIFADVDVQGKSVLDVGGGAGVAALYAETVGARRVVCMEPELDGSTSRCRERFHILRDKTQSTADFVASTLTDFSGDAFDVVLLHNTINHIDEEACIRLHRDPAAVSRYRSLLEPLVKVTKKGSALIVADVSSRNAWADAGLINPLARSIEWHKHQPPAIWTEVIEPLGFKVKSVRWTPYDPLGPLGDLFASRSASYFLRSHFVITYERL